MTSHKLSHGGIEITATTLIRVKVAQSFLDIVLWPYPSPCPTLHHTATKSNKKGEAIRLPLGTFSLGAGMGRDWQYITVGHFNLMLTKAVVLNPTGHPVMWCKPGEEAPISVSGPSRAFPAAVPHLPRVAPRHPEPSSAGLPQVSCEVERN